MKAWFTTNHDENSWNGTEYEKYGSAAKAFAVMNATWKGVPLVYSGQELPNTKRLEFFEKDAIKWGEKFELEGFYRTLFNLRSAHPALDASVPVQRLATSANDHILAYSRKKGEKEVVVLLNLSGNELSFELNGDAVNGRYRNVFSDTTLELAPGKKMQIGAWEYLVLER
jgi:glycosidase